jgi:hypothetical protein
MPLKTIRPASQKIDALLEEIQHLKAFVERHAQSPGARGANRNGQPANGSSRRKGKASGSRYLNGSS